MHDGPKLMSSDAEEDDGGSSDPHTGADDAAASIPSHSGRCRSVLPLDDLPRNSSRLSATTRHSAKLQRKLQKSCVKKLRLF